MVKTQQMVDALYARNAEGKTVALTEESPRFATLNDKGQEVLDPTPMAPPVGYFKQPTMVDIIRERIRGALSERAAEMDQDSFEDADDFDVGDDYDPQSPWEESFDPDGKTNREYVQELKDKLAAYEEEKASRKIESDLNDKDVDKPVKKADKKKADKPPYEGDND